MISGCN